MWFIASRLYHGEMIEAPGLVYYLHHIAQSAGELRRGTSKNINYPNFPKKSENKFISENYEGESSFFQQLLPSQHQIVEH